MPLPPEAAALPDRLVRHARLVPDRYALIRRLPHGGTFIEVGVHVGDFSQYVVDVLRPKRFIAIDRFDLHTLPEIWGRPTAEVFAGRTHRTSYETRFAARIAAGTTEVLEGDSAACLDRLPADSADMIYIDADHTEAAVTRDLEAARRVVRPDGWIIVNDYLMVAELGDSLSYGVVHATNAFMNAHDWGMRYFALQTRMFCDVALRPARLLDWRRRWQPLREPVKRRIGP